jgi:hypothetical protein
MPTKRIITLSAAIATLTAALCWAGVVSFPFIGRWQPSDDPVTLDDYGYQDIQNMRRVGKQLDSVHGDSNVNTTQWSSSYPIPESLYHFRKNSESHVLVQVTDGDGNATLIDNNATIPGDVAFSSSAIFTDSDDSGVGYMSPAPQGTVVYANGVDKAQVWGGYESAPTVVFVGGVGVGSAPTAHKDYTDAAINTSDDADSLLSWGNDDADLLLHCDGSAGSTTFTDATGTHSPSANGNVAIGTSYPKFSQNSAYDGSGDYISVPDHADWYLGTDDFTIDFWIYMISATNGIFQQYDDADNSIYFYTTVGTKSFQVHFGVRSGGAQIATLDGGFLYISGPSWHHVAIVRSGTDWMLFTDGVLGDTDSDSGAVPNLSAALEIGRCTYGSPGDYDGLIDEFRWVKGAALYTEEFTPPGSPYALADAKYLYVGSPYILNGVKAYVGTANTETSTLAGAAYSGASSWATLSLTDGTASGGVTMAQTGNVSWGALENDVARYIYGYSLHWYRFYLSTGKTRLSRISVQFDMQDVPNVWDGSNTPVAAFKVYKNATSKYEDYTVYAQSNDVTTSISLDSLPATDYLLAGFAVPVQGVILHMTDTKVNGTAGAGGVEYNGVSGWIGVSGISGPISASTTMAESGATTWDLNSRDMEFATAIGDDVPLYYYKITHANAYDGETELYYVEGIPAQYPLAAYRFPALFSNRLFLLDEIGGDHNKVLYSTYNTAYIFDGYDSGTLYFGDSKKLTAAAAIYNVFQSTGYEQLLITKENETYRLLGSSPDTWEVYQMSGTIGCTSPRSMAVCDVADVGEGRERHVAIWQSANGVVMCDGATIKTISDDIRCYWDENDDRYIPADAQSASIGWYDSNLRAYKLLIASGSGQATPNVELEYSLVNKDWTKLYREDSGGARPLVVGGPVYDTSGRQYSYGASVDDRRLFRLENGTTWADGTAIAKYVRAGDLLLDKERPFFNNTTVNWARVMFEDQADGNATFTHWCDGVQEVDGTNDQYVPDAVDLTGGPIYTGDCTLGPCLRHSFQIESDGNLTLTGMGFVFESDDTISQ